MRNSFSLFLFYFSACSINAQIDVNLHSNGIYLSKDDLVSGRMDTVTKFERFQFDFPDPVVPP